jgi:hypothetical protein
MCCAYVRYCVREVMDSKAGVKWTTLEKWRNYNSINCHALSGTFSLKYKYGLIGMMCLGPRDYAVSDLSCDEDSLSILSLCIFERHQNSLALTFILILVNPKHLQTKDYDNSDYQRRRRGCSADQPHFTGLDAAQHCMPED